MSDSLNELMNILMEESGEVVVACSKINRFGLESRHPLRKETNREELTEELGDLMAIVKILVKKKVLDPYEIEMASRRKIEKLRIYSPNIIKDLEETESVYDQGN